MMVPPLMMHAGFTPKKAGDHRFFHRPYVLRDTVRNRRIDRILAAEVPRTRRATGGKGAVRRPGAAAEHGGDARHQRLVHLLRADEVDMGVEAAGGEDFALARDHLGAGTDDDGDIRLDVGIAGLADGRDAVAFEADIGLHDAPVIEDQRVGDDGVDRALLVGDLALAHAVADHLAAAEFHLLAVGGEILFHLDNDVGIGKPHAVARGGAEHVGIDGAQYFRRHWWKAGITICTEGDEREPCPGRVEAFFFSLLLIPV